MLDNAMARSLAGGEIIRPHLHLGGHPLPGGGARFALYAPAAARIAVIGDWNGWDPAADPLARTGDSGVWQARVADAARGHRYKYALWDSAGARLPDKIDPFAFSAELPPATASILADPLPARAACRPANKPGSPVSVLEVHTLSWRRHPNGDGYSWAELAESLIPYALELGFTHIELLPILEHPFAGSWGYQPLGFYAPTGRLGTPAEARAFVDAAHAAGLGVILDWVPAHFPMDPHGLARYDGTALFEHFDAEQSRHPDWGTLNFDYGKPFVQAFLIGSALYALESLGADGLRVDAVASMLQLDYSRPAGTWKPNRYGGSENIEAIDFIRRLNTTIGTEVPDAVMIAEESTSWPMVTRPPAIGGLGFHAKWNMGWMHDTLGYFGRDPIHRRWHHSAITFSAAYAASEHFMLALSHDEVVHGKSSLIGKMSGDSWQKRAHLRALLALMWSWPGQKLLFMGGEFGQWREWDHDGQLDWDLLDHDEHRGIARLVGDLNRLYRAVPALSADDAPDAGFLWLDPDDADHAVFSFLRRDHKGSHALVLANLTPVERNGWRYGVPQGGRWREGVNSDAAGYGGTGAGNYGGVESEAVPAHGQPHSLVVTLPPLSVTVFVPA